MKTTHATLLCGAFLAGLAWTPQARAANPANQAAAEVLFRDAQKLATAGDFERACPKFVESQRLDPTVGTLLNIGNCYEKLGKLASAWGAFKQAEMEARSVGGTKQQAEAARRAEALSMKLAKLAILVPPAARVPGFELRRDGAVVGEGQWGSALPIDAGQHTIEATAPGRKPWSTWVRIDVDGSSVSVDVPPLEPVGAPAQDGGAVPYWGAQRIGGAAVAGVGVIGLVVGAVFGARAIAKKADADKQCLPDNPNVCYPAGMELRHDEKTAGTISTATLIAGGVLVAGGVVLVLAAPGPSSGTQHTLQLHVGLAAASAGVSVGGRW